MSPVCMKLSVWLQYSPVAGWSMGRGIEWGRCTMRQGAVPQDANTLPSKHPSAASCLTGGGVGDGRCRLGGLVAAGHLAVLQGGARQGVFAALRSGTSACSWCARSFTSPECLLRPTWCWPTSQRPRWKCLRRGEGKELGVGGQQRIMPAHHTRRQPLAHMCCAAVPPWPATLSWCTARTHVVGIAAAPPLVAVPAWGKRVERRGSGQWCLKAGSSQQGRRQLSP